METFKITIIDVGFDAATKTFHHDEKKKGERGSPCLIPVEWVKVL
jgi:hypothetical protein